MTFRIAVYLALLLITVTPASAADHVTYRIPIPDTGEFYPGVGREVRWLL